jgi:hypothetical protein
MYGLSMMQLLWLRQVESKNVMADYAECLPVGQAWDLTAWILELIDDMDQNVMILSMPIPPATPISRPSVRFFPASTVIGSLGSRTNPIEI